MLTSRASVRATTLTVDGLWRCLCPSVEPAALARALAAPCVFTSALPRPPAPSRCLRRPFSSSPATDDIHRPPVHDQPQHGAPEHANSVPGSTAGQSASPRIKYYTAHHRGAVEETNRVLQEMEHNPNVPGDVMNLARQLLWQRERKLSDWHPPLVFDALIRSQCHTAGSAGAVHKLILMLTKTGFPPTSEVYHSALRALAIHPDYWLRSGILKEMDERGIQLELEGHHSIALGLLRDGQYELALDKLEDMVKEEMEVPGYVYDIFMYTFAQLGFHDEVLQIIQHRLERAEGREPPGNPWLWHIVLDLCARDLHYEGTKYVWNRMVETNRINPPDGVVLHVINTAAGARDTALATQSIRLLAARGTKLGLHHYEPMVECYAGNDDLENALRVLCVMAQAGMEPDSGSTRSIFRLLKRLGLDDVVSGAPRILFRCSDRGDRVPVAAVNVVLEGMLSHGAQEDAMDLYKLMRKVCESGPDLATFDLLLRMHEPDPKIAVFLAAEMAALGIKPGRQTYDHMIRIYTKRGSLEVALRYLDEMGAAFGRELRRRGWLMPSTVLALLERCISEEHEATWAVIEESEARGLSVADKARRMLREKLAAGGGSSSWGPPRKVSATTETDGREVSAVSGQSGS